MKTYQSYSSAGTKRFGERIARKIAKSGARSAAKGAFVIALTGELGSGKTTFVQGFLRGFGIRRGGASPTFVLIKRYAICSKRFASIYHVDAYRLKKAKDLLALGFKEILDDPQNIVLIEWAEKIKKILPRPHRLAKHGGQARNTLWLRFSHCKKENERKISL